MKEFIVKHDSKIWSAFMITIGLLYGLVIGQLL
jgi:tetrahydromethanopterin S-methyltransferase subunit G